MDYKIIVLLLVVLFIIVLVYREITTLKDQVDKTIMTTTIASKQLNDRHESTMQHNMDKYLSQIKTIGTDNLQQLKKITLLNHQPIIQKKTSNHFTETDGSEMKSQTDAKEHKDKIFEGKPESHYYMSEETKKTANYMSHDAEQSPNTKGYYSGNNIPIYDESNNDSTSGDCSDSIYNVSKNDESQQVECNKNSCSVSFIDVSLNEQQIMDTLQTQLNNSINTFDNVFNNGFIIQYENAQSNQEEQQNNNVETLSSESILIMQVQENINVVEAENTKQDNIVEPEKPQLKTMDSYSLNELKAMAKQLLIPTTYRHQNKTKQYNKEDLYNYIQKKY
jgi:hypothetical protein